MLWAYVEQLPRLQAEQARQASMIAAFPHMTKQGARNWLDGLRRAARRISHAADGLFSLNGQPISVRGLRDQLNQALGGGFAGE